MKPVNFKGSNCVYAEDQPEYLPLPARKDADGMVTCCWGLSWKERFRVFFSGRVFVKALTFNKPLQPLLVTT